MLLGQARRRGGAASCVPSVLRQSVVVAKVSVLWVATEDESMPAFMVVLGNQENPTTGLWWKCPINMVWVVRVGSECVKEVDFYS